MKVIKKYYFSFYFLRIQPYIHEFMEHEEDEDDDNKNIPLSDSELIKRAGSSSRKTLKPVLDGYSSDNGEVRTKVYNIKSCSSSQKDENMTIIYMIIREKNRINTKTHRTKHQQI